MTWNPLSWMPASWWSWKVWRYVNPVHLVAAVPYAAVFHGCGFWGVEGSLLVIGFAHEQGDGDFNKAYTPTAPWEGIKDALSFPLGGLFYYAIRLVF